MKMDRGELESALKSCGGFLDACAQTNLRPNVLSGKSVSLAAPGKTGQSLAIRQLLVSENPNHPLHDDAMKIIEQSVKAACTIRLFHAVVFEDRINMAHNMAHNRVFCWPLTRRVFIIGA